MAESAGAGAVLTAPSSLLPGWLSRRVLRLIPPGEGLQRSHHPPKNPTASNNSSQLRNHHGIASLQPDVLLRVLAFDHFFIVERNPLLRSVRSSSKNVDRLLLGEILEAPAIAIASSTVVELVSK
jgi:hypothetical protein